jgi:DNA helicase-2/ATP-dependent DNA helicase PcrA
MKQLPTANAADLCDQIQKDIVANLATCNIDVSKPQYPIILSKVQGLLVKWLGENFAIIGDYLQKFHSGDITHDELIKMVGGTLVDFEIEQNALKQSMVSQRNAGRKENTGNAGIVFSTIHSAKGLEFDHVLLLYRNQNNMKEEDKRMYYVGLTRAKKSEYILSYDTVKTALVETRYEKVMQRLPVTQVVSASGQDMTAVS